jgi:hypothetical protein
MKKLLVLVMIGMVVMLAVAVVAGAMPDEGYIGGASTGYRAGVVADEEAALDCLAGATGGRLTREALKELRVEIALNGFYDSAPAPLVACVQPGEITVR